MWLLASGDCWLSVLSRWSVVWLLAICITQVVSGVTAGYLYHPGGQWWDCWPPYHPGGQSCDCCLYYPGGQWCDCWLSVSSRWSVVWLLAIFITKVVSGAIAGYLYHPGGLWCDCWLSVLSIWQWCDCWLSVSSRWSVVRLLAICIVHLAVVWLLAICIIQVVSGVIAGYLHHPGGEWCDCWLSVSLRWSVVWLLAICTIQVVSGETAGYLCACFIKVHVQCVTLALLQRCTVKAPLRHSAFTHFLIEIVNKNKCVQWTFQPYGLRSGCSRGHLKKKKKMYSLLL